MIWEKINDTTYRVQTSADKVQVLHFDQLKPYYGSKMPPLIRKLKELVIRGREDPASTCQ